VSEECGYRNLPREEKEEDDLLGNLVSMPGEIKGTARPNFSVRGLIRVYRGEGRRCGGRGPQLVLTHVRA